MAWDNRRRVRRREGSEGVKKLPPPRADALWPGEVRGGVEERLV